MISNFQEFVVLMLPSGTVTAENHLSRPLLYKDMMAVIDVATEAQIGIHDRGLTSYPHDTHRIDDTESFKLDVPFVFK